MIYILVGLPSFEKEISQNRVTLLHYLNSLPFYTLITPQDSFPILTPSDIVLVFMIRVYNHPSTESIVPLLDKLENHDPRSIFFYIEDFYNIPKINLFCKKYRVQNVIFSIRHELLQKKLLSYDKSYRIFFLEHYLSLDMFPKTTPPKEYDILFYGNTISYYYPLRDYLKKIFSSRKKEFRVKIIPLKSYQLDESSIIQNKLYDEISKSHLTIASSSKFDFFVKKYQEIPLSGSMILGNIPKDYDNILSTNDIVHVTTSMHPDEIIEKVRWALSNPKDIETKVKQLQERFQNLFELSKVHEHLQSILTC